MPPTAKGQPTMFSQHGQPDVASAMLGGFNEQATDAGRAAAEMFLEVYEQSLEALAGLQELVASQVDTPWVGAIAEAQARFTREMAKRQLELARQILP
jgi:hypothetical protein